MTACKNCGRDFLVAGFDGWVDGKYYNYFSDKCDDCRKKEEIK